MLTPLKNHSFVQIECALQQSLTTKSGIKIYLPQSLSLEDWCTVEGTYHSGDLKDVEGRPLEKGDKVVISYMMVSDYTMEGTGVTEGEEGSLGGETRVYNRVYSVGDELVWHADNWMIMAVESSASSRYREYVEALDKQEIYDRDGKLIEVKGQKYIANPRWVAVGEWTMMEEVGEDLPQVPDWMVLPEMMTCKKKQGIGKVVSARDWYEGQEVFFNEKFRSLYKVDGVDYIFLNQDRLLVGVEDAGGMVAAFEGIKNGNREN